MPAYAARRGGAQSASSFDHVGRGRHTCGAFTGPYGPALERANVNDDGIKIAVAVLTQALADARLPLMGVLMGV
jgi:hypothetical protein